MQEIFNWINLKAVSAFILEVVTQHGAPADIICNKEPFLMTQAGFLATAFPNSKLIHMVRDGFESFLGHNILKFSK